MSQGASGPSGELLTQGSDGLFLSPLHRHGAELQALGGLPEREAFEDGEPQGGGLGCRQLTNQLLRY
jgi:hypothetical protein